MDTAIASFCSITGTDTETALKYLDISEGNVDQALSLFYDHANIFSDPVAPTSDDEVVPTTEDEEDDNSMETEEAGQANRIYESQGTIGLWE